ncbi:DUF4268 domain-containing protein [Mameliella alba]|uniref:DUF4268 domain-containing protein n=1 Tax=Mameliella alba TaxID=561184 RepID=UPI001431CBE8|nr:DUF4268 domain-containing protein [Mameliella alba]
MSRLGRLEKVDLRSEWPTEAQDFTPWLAEEENLLLLSDTLGIDLELEAVERNVGPFRADILCKDTLSDKWVLIENQLERTDHTHLGQLITYAAGLDAVTIVWIAARIADEHRAALDWMNEITENSIRFFGLEVELWRIGESLAAPKFNLVSNPNDWSRSTQAAKRAVEASALTETQQLQLDYWKELETRLAAAGGPVKAVKAHPYSWTGHSIGRSNISLNAAMNTRDKWIRVELYLGGPDSKGYFKLLNEQRVAIEEELGVELDWQRLDMKRDSRVCFTRLDFDPWSKESWPEQHDWIVRQLGAFHSVFHPRIRNINREDAAAAS